MSIADVFLTYFPTPPSSDIIPTIFPSPFSNQPHALAEQACLLLQQYLTSENTQPRGDGSSELGKMFGVLVVSDSQARVGYLSAFSGMLDGLWHSAGFVPPIFDPLEHDRFLPAGKVALAKLSETLKKLENSAQRIELHQNILALQGQVDIILSALKQRHKTAKAARKLQRQRLLNQTELSDTERQTKMAELALASQHHKRENTNARQHWTEKIDHAQQQLNLIEQQISDLKEARATQSRQLHQQVFSTYQLHNFLHQQQSITHFYNGMPPAGSGDCAGPKLIHYAQQHQLQPLAMAEFWWGPSPATGIRHHGQYYPACRGKCRPILPFMLAGLDIQAEPCFGQAVNGAQLQIFYEDEVLLLINKPAGLMSAPGKEVNDSVFTRLLQRYPNHPELRLVHRLDMATSGLLLVAKNLKTHKKLQRQFIQREVEKRYEAVLSKQLNPIQLEGQIDLPLRVDFDDRPRQLVCFEYGKAAKTHWQVIAFETKTTRIYFYPLTGRTHQLRVHASHRDGLNAAIVGDGLYGQAAERLMLHAQRLCFTHPVSRERLNFEVPAPF